MLASPGKILSDLEVAQPSPSMAQRYRLRLEGEFYADQSEIYLNVGPSLMMGAPFPPRLTLGPSEKWKLGTLNTPPRSFRGSEVLVD